MGRPVQLSNELILDARLVGEVAEKPIADQIEFWAQLGRAIDPLLDGSHALALARAVNVTALSEQIASVDSNEGRRRVAAIVRERPFPHFEPASDRPGHLVRIESDGTRTVGRFVQRRFQPADD